MFKRKTFPAYELTPAERHASINSLASSAISHFEDAVLDLDEAHHQHAAHAAALDEQIQELAEVRAKSERDGEAALAVADKIRALVTP